MSWTAPEVHRIEPSEVADERTSLPAFLGYHRQTLLWKCSGLTEEQLKLRAVPSSTLSLLGLVRHLTDVERSWFRRRFAGEPLQVIYSTDEEPDADFDNLDSVSAEAVFAAYLTEIEACREVVAGHALDESFLHPRDHIQMSLRWVYLHMIEEYARHNGHADLLREAIDGATGE